MVKEMNLEQTVKWVIDNFEGYLYVDDPVDSGGATKYGITLRTLQYYRRMVTNNKNLEITKSNVRNLTLEEAIKIGVIVFMIEPRFDKISDWRLRLLLYDYGFHSGQFRAVRDLQSLLKNIQIDGKIGPLILNAINNSINLNSSLLLTMQLLTKREEFMQKLIIEKSSQRRFMLGWWKRTTKLQNLILGM